jgi:ribonuclease D
MRAIERRAAMSVLDAKREVLLREGDIGPSLAEKLRESRVVGWDIETSGLDWSTDRIGTCQLYSDQTGPVVLQLNGRVPMKLCDLLRDTSVTKVFHHAMFDLRFMRAQWGVQACNVRCTKIAAKLLFPEAPAEEHTLKSLLRRLENVELTKAERTSDWLSPDLTREQIEYAADDARYLLPLMGTLTRISRDRGLAGLLEHCFDHIPTRVELDVRRYSDIYLY